MELQSQTTNTVYPRKYPHTNNPQIQSSQFEYIRQGCSNVFNSGPNFTFAYIYWAFTKKATSGSACCETRMWLADRGEQS